MSFKPVSPRFQKARTFEAAKRLVLVSHPKVIDQLVLLLIYNI
jgi:hypothetical protein